YGRAGIGKTTTAHALARDMGWEVIELNASDQRTADIIDKVVGSASRMGTLDGAGIKRLIIMDEADNIHGTADRGGERAIMGLIKETSQPIILIANELYDMSPGLRTACKPIQFNSVMARSMIPALKRIVEAEGIKYGLGVIEKIAENANGDIRSAINDLQAIAQGKPSIQIEDLITGERDSKENIFKFLAKIFKSTNIREAHDAAFHLDENP
ncbi:MAG: AAA family ATPase, partial [Candidatus Methanoperedens sp.]|nr:AAA family ATPase [Candidatus Methanoperedens sp.]